MFCSYNFVLNEAPNINEVKCIVIIVLNDAPKSNDAMRVGNNVCLTAVDTQQFFMVAILPSYRKTDLPGTRDNDMITRKVRADRNKLCTGDEWRLYTR